MNDREKLIRLALEKVREIGEAGKAGVPLQSIPKDVDSNWGWLQGQWPVVVAIDTALAAQPAVDEAELAEVIRAYDPDTPEDAAHAVSEWMRGGGQ